MNYIAAEYVIYTVSTQHVRTYTYILLVCLSVWLHIYTTYKHKHKYHQRFHTNMFKYLYVVWSTYLSIYTYTYLSTYIYIYRSIHLHLYLPIYPSIYSQSINLSIDSLINQSINLSTVYMSLIPSLDITYNHSKHQITIIINIK